MSHEDWLKEEETLVRLGFAKPPSQHGSASSCKRVGLCGSF